MGTVVDGATLWLWPWLYKEEPLLSAQHGVPCRGRLGAIIIQTATVFVSGGQTKMTWRSPLTP